MSGRRANGEGSVVYDKRRSKPYRARITVGWELDMRTGTAKQVMKDLGSYKTKGEATRALAEYERSPYDLTNKNITFSELYKRWYSDFVEDHKSSEYKIKAAYKYCSLLYNKKIREITIVDMKDCINKGSIIETRGANKGKRKTATPTVKEDMKYLFNHLFAFATEARLVDHNLAKEFSLDKKVFREKEANKEAKVPFSDVELRTLWDNIDTVPFADMILYNCYSGWRPSELVDLRVEDVHLDENYIVGGEKTEAGIGRVVPIHSAVKFIVEKYYNAAMLAGSERLFNDLNKMRGIYFTYDHYSSKFKKAVEILGLNSALTPHCCRHTFITIAKRAKMDEHILKRIVGHKQDDITETVYTHRNIQELIDQMELIQVRQS